MSEPGPPQGLTDPRNGLFLAFEGVEGSGKTTQVARLADRLRAAGREVLVAREPGSTPVGERLREIVLAGSGSLEVPPRTELFVMLAARAAFVEQVVRPGLEAGRVVIADRFELSTLAYQGAGRGLEVEEIARMNAFATGGLRPDATILLDLDPAEGSRRQGRAGKSRDRMESESQAFHLRVARGYRELAGSVDGLIRVDAAAPVDVVEGRIQAALASRFPETFAAAGFMTRSAPGDFGGASNSHEVPEEE